MHFTYIIPLPFIRQWTVTLPSLFTPLSLFLSVSLSFVLSLSGSVLPNIRGSPVICDPSDQHLISLKRGSIQRAARRAPNSPSSLWQVSTLATQLVLGPMPRTPSATLNLNYLRPIEKEAHNRDCRGGGEEGEDKGEITLSDSY